VRQARDWFREVARAVVNVIDILLGRLREDTASKAAPLGADDDSTDGVNPMCRTEV